jgi:hypothetical protein
MKLLAERMAAGEDFQGVGIENGKMANWKDDLDRAAQGLATVENRRKVAEGQILTLRNRNAEEVGMDAKAVAHELIKAIDAEMKGFKPKTSSEYSVVGAALKAIKAGAAKGDDDDVELVNTGFQNSDFICPVTHAKMDKPLRNKQCGHRISEPALPMVVKNKRCPIPGCEALWTKHNVVEDVDHAYNMMKFYREKSEKEATQQQSARPEVNISGTEQAAYTLL